MKQSRSWGNYPSAPAKSEYALMWVPENFDRWAGGICPHGFGRSYGDVCLNGDGTLLLTRGLNRLVSFDQEKGVLRCESGVMLGDIIDFALPRGWFLPVTPGTKFVTVGGAIANDVHGKNHHKAGTFGCHVRELSLLRSDRGLMRCAPDENQEYFNAAISGLGLTGLITEAAIALKRVDSPLIMAEAVRFRSLKEFFELSEKSDRDFEYTVSWVDCVSAGRAFGRGVFFRGSHAPRGTKWKPGDFSCRTPRLNVPFFLPAILLNRFSMRVFNELYYDAQSLKSEMAPGKKAVHFDPFFYPLDGINNWNRIYGKRGFLQFQCVIPKESQMEGISALLQMVVRSGRASFLAVLKCFGAIRSPGLLSFPKEGTTLTLDFPFRGEGSLKLVRALHAIVREHGGRIYPAKDAVMSPEEFENFYPEVKSFEKRMDPYFSSSFWRRIRNGGQPSM